MKKMMWLLMLVVLLAGCGGPAEGETTLPAQTTQMPETTPVTEPPTLLEQGTPWQGQEHLLELPMEIEGRYGVSEAFCGKLLLWGMEELEDGTTCYALCLVNLETGAVEHQTQVECQSYLSPQILGDRIYFCDRVADTITELGPTLEVESIWQTELGSEGCMGSGQTLYNWTGEQLHRTDLETGQTESLYGEESTVTWMNPDGRYAAVVYTDNATGIQATDYLDLMTGARMQVPFLGEFDSVSICGDTWLARAMYGSNCYYLGDDADALRSTREMGYAQLLSQGYLLENGYDEGSSLRLYDLEGNHISTCYLALEGYYYMTGDPVFNADQTGCYFQLEGYEGDSHILYWDLTADCDREESAWEPAPGPEEAMAMLKTEADRIGQVYGVTILLGAACDTEFPEFSARWFTDYEGVRQELEMLELALSSYPAGFFEQMKYGDVETIEIQLVQELLPQVGSMFEAGSYTAFLRTDWDRHLMVVDAVKATDDGIYYHEISHIIDDYLQWDAWNRAGALYTEEGWAAHNPDWFDYAYDYAAEFDIFDDAALGDWFIDSYATTFPTEDRARIMENAMSVYGGDYFAEHPGLREKLGYYARCIRDAFDTANWPEVTVWEQYLE